ncbi:MAG: DUF924 domain-containing protein [Rhizobiales bacterium]|nr:DUF924 domain-containing protein [Hyphomicrobiales bacterium]
MQPETVIRIWQEAGESRWFTRDAAFDGFLRTRFGTALSEARQGAFDHWAATADGTLALVILLDQFSRNIHRGSPLAFAADPKALALAKAAVTQGHHARMVPPRAQWLVMPFEHAEDMDCQYRAVALFTVMGLSGMAHWAQVHLDIIARFGRFPHRNVILGRPSTAAEIAFLESGGFAG